MCVAAAGQILVGAYGEHAIGRGRNGRTPRLPKTQTTKSRNCQPRRSAVSAFGRLVTGRLRLPFLSPQFPPSPPSEPQCLAVHSLSFSRCSPSLAPPRKRRRARHRALRLTPISGWKTSAARRRWRGSRPRTRRRRRCSRRIRASRRCSATRWRSRRPATAFRTCASSAASSTTSGRTARTCAASGGERRWRVIAPRRRSGRRFSISTRSRARRRRTGSGKAPTARSRPSAGACSACRMGAKTRQRSARIRPRHALVPEGWIRPSARQAERRVGRRGHAARVARVEQGRAHRVGLSIRREAPGARPAAHCRRRGLPRRFPRMFRWDRASIFDGAGHRAVILYRGVSFFEAEYLWCRHVGRHEARLPLKSQPVAMVDGQLIVKLSEAWNDGATHIRTGLARVVRRGEGRAPIRRICRRWPCSSRGRESRWTGPRRRATGSSPRCTRTSAAGRSSSRAPRTERGRALRCRFPTTWRSRSPTRICTAPKRS